MKYSLLIAAREFAEHVKTRGFLIGLAIFPFMLFVGFRAPKLLEKFAAPTRYFAVIDPTGEYMPLIDAAVAKHYDKKDNDARVEWLTKKQKDASTPDYVPIKPFFVRVPPPEGTVVDKDPAATMLNLKPYLLDKKKIQVDGKEQELFALFVMPTMRERLKKGVQFWSVNLTDDTLPDVVAHALQDDVRSREYESSGVSRADAERIAKIEVQLDDKDPRKAAGEEDVGIAEKVRQWTPVGFVYLMFVALITVAQMLLSSTIEEKASRIFEVLLSSVTPGELMLGKLIGVAGVGLTMLTSWLLCLFMVLRWFAGDATEVTGPLMSLVFTPSVLVPLACYFLLGFLMFASLLLALGSLCNTLKEAQNFMGPVMMVLSVPLISMVFIARDPNGTLAHVLTWIPPFTPFVMMNRIAGDPTALEIGGTLVLLALCVAIAVWLAGRIFRNGVLRTGAPPKFIEVLRLLRS